MSGKNILAEDGVKRGVEPVGKRRLFEVADAVDLHGDPIAAFVHVLRDLGVGSIYVVEQGRGEKRGDLDTQKNGHEKRPRCEGGGRLRRRLRKFECALHRVRIKQGIETKNNSHLHDLSHAPKHDDFDADIGTRAIRCKTVGLDGAK